VLVCKECSSFFFNKVIDKNVGKVRNDAEDEDADGRKGKNGQGRSDASNAADMMKRKQKSDENGYNEKKIKEKLSEKDS